MKGWRAGLGRVLILACLAPVAACASAGWPRASESLKADAPSTARQAALFVLGNSDPERAARHAEAVLRDSRASAPEKARAYATLVVASDMTGEFERTLPFVAERLVAAATPEDAFVAASSLDRVWGRLDGGAPDDPAVIAALAGVTWRSDAGYALAAFELARQEVSASRLTRGSASESEATEAAGMLTRWRISGPWGHTPTLDLAAYQGPETRSLAAVEHPGSEWRDALQTSDETFSDGDVLVFDLDGRPGLAFAEALTGASPGGPRSWLAFETNRLARVFVGGQLVAERADPYTSTFMSQVIATPPPGTRVTVKLASQDGRGFFRVALRPYAPSGEVSSGADPRALASLGPTDPAAVIDAILEFQRLLGRPYRDPVGAERILNAVAKTLGESPVVTWMRFRLAFIDLDAGWGRRRETLRAHLEVLGRQWPDAPVFKRDLARIEREEQRPEVALGLLTANDPRTQLERLELLRERGWEARALALVATLLAEQPDSPRVAQEAIDTYATFGRVEDALALATTLDARWPGFGAGRLAAFHLDAGRAAEAAIISAEMFKARPQRHADLRATVEALRIAGDQPAAREALRLFLASRPADLWALAERVRLELGCALPVSPSSRRPACDALVGYLAAVLAESPSHAPVASLSALVASEAEIFDAAPSDGAQRLADARARALAADSPLMAFPVVTVLDRSHTRVLADGGTVELAHRVRQANTRQGADALGDVRVPAGARLLIARTIKADGRVVYPEITPGKTDISLSELKPGDAVETAWVSYSRVEPDEGGYLTSIGFAHIGVPILAIERDIELPSALGLDISLRHGAPSAERHTLPDGGTAYRWRVTPDLARDFWPRESGSPSARSFTPYADLRVIRALAALHSPSDVLAERQAALLAIARAYAERLRHLAAPGPRLHDRAIALSVAARRADVDYAALAADWVREHIEASEPDNQFDSSVEKALGTGRGNRALVLLSLLRRDDPTASLILCAPEREGPLPDADAPLPNANRFSFPLLSHRGRLYDVSRLHTDPTALPAELRGATCLDSLASERGVLAMTQIPRGSPDGFSFDFNINVRLHASGAADVELQGVFSGPNAAGLRQVWVKQDEVRRRMIWEQWLSGLFQGATLTSAEVRDAASARAPMRVKLMFTVPSFARIEGDTLIVTRLSATTLMANDFTGAPDLVDLVGLPTRRTPLRVPPHDERVRWVVTAPAGFETVGDSIAAKPEAIPDALVEDKTGTLFNFRDQGQVKAGKAALECTHESLFTPGIVQPGAAYDAVRELVNGVASARARPYAFKKKE